MNIEEYREYCLSFRGVTEELPFGPDTLVFKVGGKMFALSGIDDFQSVNLKCEPENAILLREEYEDVKPGWHMNKRHWNTVSTQGSISDKLLKEWIKVSYELVHSSLSKKIRVEIAELD